MQTAQKITPPSEEQLFFFDIYQPQTFLTAMLLGSVDNLCANVPRLVRGIQFDFDENKVFSHCSRSQDPANKSRTLAF
jgi:hypothetical protein